MSGLPNYVLRRAVTLPLNSGIDDQASEKRTPATFAFGSTSDLHPNGLRRVRKRARGNTLTIFTRIEDEAGATLGTQQILR